jgi:hypothetical protein
MACQIAEALRDPLAYYRKMPKYTVYSLSSILSEELPAGKLLCNEVGSTVDWHRFVLAHDPGSEAYAVYNLAMCEFEERKCLR